MIGGYYDNHGTIDAPRDWDEFRECCRAAVLRMAADGSHTLTIRQIIALNSWIKNGSVSVRVRIVLESWKFEKINSMRYVIPEGFK